MGFNSVFKGLTSALVGCGWSRQPLGRFTPGKGTRYPLFRGWAGSGAGPDGGGENFAHTGIRFPDRPALSESLYRLNSPGSQMCVI